MQLKLVVAHTQVIDYVELVLRIETLEDVAGPIEGIACSLRNFIDPSKIAQEVGFGFFAMSVLLDKEALAAQVSCMFYWFQHSSFEKFIQFFVCCILEVAGVGENGIM